MKRKKKNHMRQTMEKQRFILTKNAKRVQYRVIAMTELRFFRTRARELADGASQSCAEGRSRSRAERLKHLVRRSGSPRYHGDGFILNPQRGRLNERQIGWYRGKECFIVPEAECFGDVFCR